MTSDTDDAGSDSDSELLLHDAGRVSPASLRRRLSGRRPSTAAPAPRTAALLAARPRHQCSVCAVSPAASPLIPKRGQSLETACGAQGGAQDGGLPRQTSFPPYLRRRATTTTTTMASTPPPPRPTAPAGELAAGGEDSLSRDKRFKFVAARSRTVSSVLLALKSNSNFQSQTERVMYGRSQRGMHMRTPVMGGTPITEQQAVQLRTVVFGDAATPPRSEWSRTGLVMREPERDLGYGLRAPRNGTRGLLAVVQAYLVKHLLFEAPPGMEGAGPPTGRPEELLRPSRARQYEALWAVVSAILWKVGEQQRVQVALPQEKNLVPHSPSYFQDGVTEKLHLFEFTSLQDLQIFMKQYLYLFTDDPGPGTLLLLYSAVLTRGCDKVQADLEDEKACLVTTAEEGPQTIVTLLLVGRATPYLHNGIVYVGDEDHYALPQYGVLNRSDVGYLVWDDTNESELQESSRQPGSRLKTPSLPVWVVSCSGHYGVIFNTNRELLRNYHAERRFELLYYTAGAGQWSLTVDTRFNEAGESTSNKSSSASSSRPKDDFTTTAQALCLEKVIHTKWQDAHVTWNSMIPGV